MSTCSTGTTVSVPSGTAAPVMIWQAFSPRTNTGSPAACRRSTAIGVPAGKPLCEADSAKPSIAELSKPGRFTPGQHILRQHPAIQPGQLDGLDRRRRDMQANGP